MRNLKISIDKFNAMNEVKTSSQFVEIIAKQYDNQGLSFSKLVEIGNRGLKIAELKTRGLKNADKKKSLTVWLIREAILSELKRLGQ